MVNTKGIRAFLQDSKAVSPAIATLILIVVAAVAAAAIGVMVQSSQGDAGQTLTEKSAEVEGKISIKGSTTVLPVSQLAAVGFMGDNPSYSVSVSGGGSGYGQWAIFTKSVDIGQSSSKWSTETKEVNGITLPARKDAIIQEAGEDATIWESAIGTGMIVVAGAAKNNAGAAITAINVTNDIDYSTPGISTGSTILNLSFANLSTMYTTGTVTIGTLVLEAVQREDPSGTEETFAAWINLKDANGQLIGDATAKQGNQGIRDYIAAYSTSETAGVIGFVDVGFAADGANGNSKVIAAKQNGTEAKESNKNVGGPYDKASLTNTGTGKGLARDLFYYTYGVPKGSVKLFLEYITGPHGQNDVKAAGFFST